MCARRKKLCRLTNRNAHKDLILELNALVSEPLLFGPRDAGRVPSRIPSTALHPASQGSCSIARTTARAGSPYRYHPGIDPAEPVAPLTDALKLRALPITDIGEYFKISLPGKKLPRWVVVLSRRVKPCGLRCCDRSTPDVELPEMIEQPIEIPDPQNQNDDHHAIQDRFDLPLHRNKPVHKPQH